MDLCAAPGERSVRRRGGLPAARAGAAARGGRAPRAGGARDPRPAAA